MKRQTETNTQGEKTSILNGLRPIPYFMAIIAVVVASMLSYSLTIPNENGIAAVELHNITTLASGTFMILMGVAIVGMTLSEKFIDALAVGVIMVGLLFSSFAVISHNQNKALDTIIPILEESGYSKVQKVSQSDNEDRFLYGEKNGKSYVFNIEGKDGKPYVTDKKDSAKITVYENESIMN